MEVGSLSFRAPQALIGLVRHGRVARETFADAGIQAVVGYHSSKVKVVRNVGVCTRGVHLTCRQYSMLTRWCDATSGNGLQGSLTVSSEGGSPLAQRALSSRRRDNVVNQKLRSSAGIVDPHYDPRGCHVDYDEFVLSPVSDDCQAEG